MKVLKKQWLTLVLLAALVMTLVFGVVFALPASSAKADEFTPNVTVGTEKALKEAVLSAQSGVNKKIQLTEDIALGIENVNGEAWGLRVAGGRDITLDLNGHKLSRASSDWVLLCNVNSKLTLIDTSEEKTGIVTSDMIWGGQPLVWNYGQMTTGVNFTVPDFVTQNGVTPYQDPYGLSSGNNAAISSVTDANYAKAENSSWKKPSLTITGGTFRGPVQGSAIKLTDSDLTVTGGTFVPNHLTEAPEGYVLSSLSTRKIFTINTLALNAPLGSTTVEAAKEAAKTSLDTYMRYRGSNVTVTGGDFTAYTSEYGDMDIDPKIYVGYNPWPNSPNAYSNGDTGETADVVITLDGSSKWGKDLSAYTPEGKWMELFDPSIDEGPEAEAYYIVSDASEAAAGATVTIGQSTRYYTDFASAFAAIGTTEEDRTIKLCNDAKVEQLDFSKMSGNVTLDLNGKKLTIERRSSSTSGHIYFGSRYSSDATVISLTVKDGANGGGEIVFVTPSGGSIGTNSFIRIDNNAKFTLESGTIRQTGYFPADYEETQFNTVRDDEKAAEAIFHLSTDEAGAVLIKGGNIVSEIYYGTEEDHGELTSSPYLVSWYVATFDYELNFETGEKYPNKAEIFTFDLTGFIEAGNTSVVSWNFKAEGDGAAQWEALGDAFTPFTFSGYGKDFMVSNFTAEDNFLGSDGSRHATLKAAADAKKGENYFITILQDELTLEESVMLDGIALDFDRNRNFTLNLAEGVTLTLTGGAALRNGTLNGGATVTGNAAMQNMTVTGDVTVNGGILTIPSGTYQGGFTVAEGAAFDITGGWFKGKAIETVDQGFAFTLGAYIEAGQNYVDETMYEVKIAPDLKAQKWYRDNQGKTAFEIASTDDWNSFAIYVSSGVDVFAGKTVKLTKELDFGYNPAGVALFAAREAEKPFLPAGNQTYRFNGTFDGGNNTIKGIYVTERNAGLFGGTNGSAKINNITVENSVFKAGSGYFDVYNREKGYVFAGGIIAQGNQGHNAENAAKGIKLKNITITQEEGAGNLMGGGFVGQTWSNLYLEGIEIEGITLDGNWKLGGLVGYTEASVFVTDGKISDFESLRDGYCVGVISGHANGGGKGTAAQLTNCNIVAEDAALIGSMYSSGRDSDFVIDGPDTYIVADKLVDSNADRTETSQSIIQYSSEVEEDGLIHRTTVKLGHGKEEEKLNFADENGDPLPEEKQPKFNDDGSLDSVTKIDVIIANLTGKATYNATNELNFEVDSFVLVTADGIVLSDIGDVKISVTVELSNYGVGKQVALITAYTADGADANNYNYLPAGNQTFVDVTVQAAMLTVSVNENGEVVYDGFVGGEDESVLGGTLMLTKVDNGDGTYTVTPSGLESENYNIVYTSAVVSADVFETNSNALWIALAVVGSVLAVCGAAAIVFTVRRKRAE